MEEHREEPVTAYWDPAPRWLRHSGLPEVLGNSAMTMAELLIRQALSRRSLARPDRDVNGNEFPEHSVPFTREGLGRQMGLGRDAASRAFKVVQKHNIARQVQEGFGYPDGRSAASWAQVNLQLIEQIYVLTCNEIHSTVGGQWERLQGAQDRSIKVRVFQGAAPTEIDKRLFSHERWNEPPVPLVKALCLQPQRYEELLQHKMDVIDVETRCLRRLDAGTSISLAEFPEAIEKLGQLWVPEPLRQLVRQLLTRGAGG